MGSKLTRHDENAIREILRDKFEYYNQLSLEGKKKFFKRLIDFIKTKRFIGKEGLVITEEMLVLVGASAIQLTFGLKRYVISHFKIIMLFPSTFHFRLLNKDLKGGTSPKGTIWLSWEAFQHGYEVPDDKRNLGLHELAHALKLSVLHGYTFDKNFASYIEDWNEVATKEFRNLKGGGASFFRKYGGTNRMEFFAVAVEHFYEAPKEFHKELPDVYNHLCVLLNQNPMNERGDFELTKGYIKKANLTRRKFPLPEKIRMSYEYHSFHWSYPVLGFGGFIGYSVSKAYYDDTLVSPDEIYILMFILMVVGGILQYQSLVRTKVWSLLSYPVYLLFGFVPVACAALFILNFNFTVPEKHTEVHEVTGMVREGNASVYVLANGVFHDHQAFRAYIGRRDTYPTKVTHIEFTFIKGFLGYWVLEDRQLKWSTPKEDS